MRKPLLNHTPLYRKLRQLSLLLALLLMPIGAWAEDYPILVGNTRLTDTNISNYPISWDASSRTITLTNANLTETITWDGQRSYYGSSLTIKLKGVNKISTGNQFCLIEDRDKTESGSGYGLTFVAADDDSELTMECNKIGNAGSPIDGFNNMTNPDLFDLYQTLTSTSEKYTMKLVRYYGITIAGHPVTKDNVSSKIEGDNITGTVEYDKDKYTLTLEKATLKAPIRWENHYDLKIILKGQNYITTGDSPCIYSTAYVENLDHSMSSSASTRGSIEYFSDLSFDKAGDDPSYLGLSCNEGTDVISGFGNSTKPDTPPEKLFFNQVGQSYKAEVREEYSVIIGDEIIHSGNYKDVLNDKTDTTEPTVSFNPDNNTLTLNEASFSKVIKDGLKALTIHLIGENTIDGGTTRPGIEITTLNAKLTFTSPVNENNEPTGMLVFEYVTTPIDGPVNIYYENDLAFGTDENGNKAVMYFENYLEINGVRISDDYSANGNSGTIAYSKNDKTITLTNYQKNFEGDAIVTSIVGLKVKLAGKSTFTIPDKAHAFRAMLAATSIKFMKDGNGSEELTVTTSDTPFKNFSNENVTYDGLICFLSGDSQWTIEALPATPEIAYDDAKTYLDTDEIVITGPENTTLFYTWGDAKIGTEYTHTTDNPTLTIYTAPDAAAQAGTHTLRAWAGKTIGANRYLMSEAASQAFRVLTDIATCEISENTETEPYKGSKYEPTFKVTSSTSTLILNTDYIVAYYKVENDVVGNTPVDMIEVGEYKIVISGIGNYGGTNGYNFEITKANLSSVSIAEIADQTYTGSEIKPEIKVTLNNLTLNPDDYGYTVSYSNNKNAAASTAVNAPTVTLTALDTSKYFEDGTTQTATFAIDQLNIAGADITLDKTELTYNEAEQTVNVTKVMVGTIEVPANSYEVSGNVQTAAGEHTVTVTAKPNEGEFKNNFKGYATTTFIIKDRTAEIKFGNGLKFMTYYKANENFLIPDNVSAYIVTGVNGDMVSIRKVSFLKAKVPLLLAKTEGSTSTKNPDEDFTGNKLAYADADVETTGSEFVLYKNEFVKATETIPLGKCFLNLAGVAPSRGMYGIGNDDSTSIDATLLDNEENHEEWYDLQGRRIAKPTKAGLYIMNGKKVVVNNK